MKVKDVKIGSFFGDGKEPYCKITSETYVNLQTCEVFFDMDFKVTEILEVEDLQEQEELLTPFIFVRRATGFKFKDKMYWKLNDDRAFDSKGRIVDFSDPMIMVALRTAHFVFNHAGEL